MIEYALIAVLVMLGVVTMGPYVLRTVNAHFKLWDEGVQDSFTENITQSSTIPYIPANCVCTPKTIKCNGSPTSFCGPTQDEVDYNCTPQGCNGAAGNSYCVEDPSCCTGWTPVGCGTIPLGQPPTNNNCNYGYQRQMQECGNNGTYQCVQSSSCPMPACLGIIAQANTEACPNGPPGNGTPLNQNYGITLVPTCTAGAYCQFTCKPPFIDVNGICSCPSGYILQNGTCSLCQVLVPLPSGTNYAAGGGAGNNVWYSNQPNNWTGDALNVGDWVCQNYAIQNNLPSIYLVDIHAVDSGEWQSYYTTQGCSTPGFSAPYSTLGTNLMAPGISTLPAPGCQIETAQSSQQMRIDQVICSGISSNPSCPRPSGT